MTSESLSERRRFSWLLRYRWLWPVDGWLLACCLLSALLLSPLVVVFIGAFGAGSETWDHLASTVLARYLVNTILLLAGTGVLAAVWAIPTAWLTACCEFPGRRFFKWVLVLPLALPTYITAYAYAGLFDYAGPVKTALRSFGVATSWVPDILSLPGAVLVLSLALFPYLFLITQTCFVRQSKGMIEASRMLGHSSLATFFRAGLPSARPAIAAGMTLVLMETLNDYGAVKHYGVDTFATGIFRAWFSLGDLPSALRLASLLMLVVVLVLAAERWQRGRAQYESKPQGVLARRQLAGLSAWGAAAACGLPFLLGFALPALQLFYWWQQGDFRALGEDAVRVIFNTFALGGTASALAVASALLVVYTARLHSGILTSWLTRLSVLGYSVPGAVIAVGVLVSALAIGRTADRWLQESIGVSTGLFLTGTVTALVFAYVVRFLAVAFNPLRSGFEESCAGLDQAARSLGSSPWRTLVRINLPLLKGPLLAGAILVFVDVAKELPLTLVLRPFDFDTLSTKVYQLANDERVAESAHLALAIVLVSLIPLFTLTRLIHGRRP